MYSIGGMYSIGIKKVMKLDVCARNLFFLPMVAGVGLFDVLRDR